MTRKDYEKFARMFSELYDKHRGIVSDEAAEFTRIVCKVAEFFQADNPRFNRDRFIRACYTKGYGQ